MNYAFLCALPEPHRIIWIVLHSLTLMYIATNDKIRYKVEAVAPLNHYHVLTGGITSHLSTVNGQ